MAGVRQDPGGQQKPLKQRKMKMIKSPFQTTSSRLQFEPFKYLECNYHNEFNFEDFLDNKEAYLCQYPYMTSTLNELTTQVWSTPKLETISNRRRMSAKNHSHIYSHYYLMIPSVVLSNTRTNGAQKELARSLSSFYMKNFQSKQDRVEIQQLVFNNHKQMIHHIVFRNIMKEKTAEEAKTYDSTKCPVEVKDISIVAAASFSYDEEDGTFCHWIMVDLDQKNYYNAPQRNPNKKRKRVGKTYYGHNLGAFNFIYNQHIMG